MVYGIIHLPKEQWKGTIIPIRYTTDQYYDVTVSKIDNKFTIEIEKKDFAEPIIHTAKEQARRERHLNSRTLLIKRR